MSSFQGRIGWIYAGVAMLIATLVVHAAPLSTQPVVRPTSGAATSPTTGVATTRTAEGPDVVMLSELVGLYEPVPFEHKRHAQMAEMWDGCTTCHHHTPKATGAPTTQQLAATRAHPSQENSAAIPACKSCHPVAGETPGIHMPSLKGAYHRQCLNCHREWMETNACVICHAAKGNGVAKSTTQPVPDDIVGRMHKPIPAPREKLYVARFTPVAGGNVLFRHEEHVKGFGIKCVSCHRRDSCADCHAGTTVASTTGPAISGPATTRATTTVAAATVVGAGGPRPLHPGRTWRETHGPCVACHQQDHCSECHYKDGQAAPAAFDHARKTGQSLDEDHEGLRCLQCHAKFKSAVGIGCGDSSCHEHPMSFPKRRPGAYVKPTTQAVTGRSPQPSTTQPATTQPSSKPVIILIRRGGS